MVMPERRLVAEIESDLASRFEPDDARRRAQVVDQAVGPREPGERDDLLVVDPFAAEARLLRVGNVPLARIEPSRW